MANRLLGLCMVAVFLVLSVALVPLGTSSATGDLAGIKICLDSGHGGSDPGAVFSDGIIHLEEEDVNLDVAYGLKALLEVDGAVVVMTRTDDSNKSNSDRYTFCNDQGATILVSVHINSTTSSTTDGSLALYFHADDKALAQHIYSVMYPYLQHSEPSIDPEGFTSFGLDRFASGVLLKSNMPAAMMEPLFMSNPAEAGLLVTSIYTDDGITPNLDCINCRRAQIAQAIHDGVLAYFDSPEPSPTPTPEPGGVMHISAINLGYDKRGPNYVVHTQVKVVDENGVPVPDATVYIDTTLPDTSKVSEIATTQADGRATFTVRSRQTGTYISTVTNVIKSGWTYDSTSNAQTSDSIDVP